MPDVFFTADFHLGHANIIRYCNRPFANVAEMDEAILSRLNAQVKHGDHLYFLGDFCIGGAKAATVYLGRVRCKNIYLVPGNHDKDLSKLSDHFVWIKPLAEEVIRGQKVVLCHYAMRVWNQHRRGAWHLHGHSHGKLVPEGTALSLDVGVDVHDFRPWHIDEIKQWMNNRTADPPLSTEDDG